MMRIAALLIVALVALGGLAQAQDSKSDSEWADQYKRVGSWAIWRARSDRYCYLDSQTRGPTITIGFVEKRTLLVALTHEAWRSLELGKDYAMVLQFDDQQQPVVMKTWRVPGGNAVVLGRTFTDEAESRRFLQDFQRSSRLSVIYEGRTLASYVLQYSNMAGEELLRCQAAAAPSSTADSDPFKPRPTGGAASDKPGPAGGAAPQGPVLPKLTADQRVEAVRLAAHLLARLPGFRILSEEEQKALDPKVAAVGAAVVWRNEGSMGLLHVFPNLTEAGIPKVAGRILGGMAEDCDGEFNGTIVPDVRSPSVRRIHISCMHGNGVAFRVIFMPFKGGAYYLLTGGALKDTAAIQRTEELLRNALFEVVQK